MKTNELRDDDPAAPWLTDPKYGGMSPLSARRSYEAWERQGRKTLPSKRPPASDAEIAWHKRNIEAQLSEYAADIKAYAKWWKGWKSRRPKGFRATRRQ